MLKSRPELSLIELIQRLLAGRFGASSAPRPAYPAGVDHAEMDDFYALQQAGFERSRRRAGMRKPKA